MGIHFDRNSEWYCNIDPLLRLGTDPETSEDPSEVTCQRCLLQMERHPREDD